MAFLRKIKSHPNVINYSKELPFYNTKIKNAKTKILKNIDLLPELPFYEQLNVIKTDRVFRGYLMSYKVELIEKKNPVIQLEASKLSIIELFNDLLDETKGFKYQITVKILCKTTMTQKLNFLPFSLTGQQKP